MNTTNCTNSETFNYAGIMARGGNSILISGESGTGKELLARGIHRAGPCPEGPFVAVNVSSVPEALFESQFFGHVKGAFTGAERDHSGFFEQADGGALFLDEVGELPEHIQVKFLRVLEERAVARLGGQEPRQVDVRIVSSTNKDLDRACREGTFRLDLLYRLKSAHIHLPPLRERRGDIGLLASHFLHTACTRYTREIRGFSPEAMEVLTRRDHPGNIRELRQVVERAVLLADSVFISPHHLAENTRLPCLLRVPQRAICAPSRKTTNATWPLCLRRQREIENRLLKSWESR